MAVRTQTNVKSLRTIRGRHVDMETVLILLEVIHVNANRDMFTKDRALQTISHAKTAPVDPES